MTTEPHDGNSTTVTYAPPPASPPPGSPPPPPPPPYLGLVRPRQGRYIAGVCAGLGRATNTDPVLWRILLPALTLLGGIGLLVYLFGWLLIPSEGDTASPFESLIGRGHSSTRPWVAAILTAIAAFAVIGAFSDGPGAGAILVAAAVAAVVLVLSSGRSRPGQPQPGEATPAVPQPKPRTARRILFSLVLLAIGSLALVDLANLATIPASAYFALALAVLGIGMMIAAFLGRVRGPVTLGILLTLGLAATTALGSVPMNTHVRELNYRPTTLAALQDHYDEDAARITVDLTQLDFTGVDRTIDFNVSVGEIRVILPPNVDTTVSARVNVGDVAAFDRRNSGIDPAPVTTTDYGADGAGGGTLHINADLNVGQIEVTR